MSNDIYDPKLAERLRDRMRRFELSELERRGKPKKAAAARFSNSVKKTQKAPVKGAKAS
jgi:hypothetical protein